MRTARLLHRCTLGQGTPDPKGHRAGESGRWLLVCAFIHGGRRMTSVAQTSRISRHDARETSAAFLNERYSGTLLFHHTADAVSIGQKTGQTDEGSGIWSQGSGERRERHQAVHEYDTNKRMSLPTPVEQCDAPGIRLFVKSFRVPSGRGSFPLLVPLPNRAAPAKGEQQGDNTATCHTQQHNQAEPDPQPWCR